MTPEKGFGSVPAMTEVEKYKRQWARRRWYQRIEGGLMLALALALAAVLLVAIDSAKVLSDSPSPRVWFSMTVVAVPGAGLLWLGIRRMRAELAPPQVKREPTELEQAANTFAQCVWDAGVRPENLSGLLMLQILELASAQKWSELLQEAGKLRGLGCAHPWIDWIESLALAGLMRHSEATAKMETLLGVEFETPEAALVLVCDMAKLRMTQGRLDLAMSLVERIRSSETSDAFKACCLDSVATLMVYRHDLPRRDVLLSWAQEALRLCPDRLTLKGTLASALCENDRWDEAEPLLREVLEKSPGLVDQGICAAYLARLCHRRGDLPGAKDWLAYSRYVFPSSELDARLRRELPELYEKTAGGSLRRPAT